ncbi:MFS transporter [Ktedonosporobacter rubrisoli]|uniref:Putative proline/betaine transporter n=1 Tax=Ktedonosporobacter rubrisoli TaxID=2509675 RepID=A0A4P6JTW8_KTERU|nr:MFS transporter [Ktedonosporobacter rubrisoli]QBD78356.1 MFS transporter [Ktedonosporobacter rubrisoli]
MASISEQMSRRGMWPVIFASTLGTTIEWYDFFLYGTVATLVFPALYFPKFSPFAGTLLSLTTFLVGFIARPIGGVVFGHLGDRIGRKSTLIVTLLLMGISTFVIGFIPGYDVIGIAAPLLVSLMRFCQGLGVGGEWGGSVLLSLEYGHERNRGFWASWPQMGVPLGLLLSAGLVAVFAAISGSQFNSWGWRIPFFLSALLIVVGLYIRLRILETPLFSKLQEEKRVAKAPVVEVIAQNWEEIILTAAARFVEQAPFYLFSTFVLVYGATYLHVDRQLVLGGIYAAAILELLTIPWFSYLSDRFGRRRWYLLGCLLMLLFAFPYFLLLNTGNGFLIIASIVLSLALCHSFVYGPQAALISEHFTTRLRYSGASIGYQLAAPFAGGLAPLIAAFLLEQYKGDYVPVALYIIILAAFSFVATLGLKELSKASIAD